jgi:IclR family mhp operon transcriptional activator
MKDYKVKEINALARGAEVLKLLHSRSALSLHEIHSATGIAKSTLTRILLTLYRQGLVWQRLGDGAYLPSRCLQRRRDPEDAQWIAELGSPLLAALGTTVPWPSLISVPRDDHMEVVETNGMQTYFDALERYAIGFQANILRSASGRAFLAFCSDAHRQRVLGKLRDSARPGAELAANADYLARIIERARRDGYGLRSRDFGGDFARGRDYRDDQRETLALPICHGGTVVACISLTWKRRVVTREHIVRRYLPALQAAAAELESAVDAGLRAS